MTTQPRLEGQQLAAALGLWHNGKRWRTDQIAKHLRVPESAVYNSVFHAYATADANVVPLRRKVAG